MEAPPDPAPHAAASASAPAAAPLRAPEVARLREEQEKVTGRGPTRACFRPGLGGARGPPRPGPALGPARSLAAPGGGRSAPRPRGDGERWEKLLSRARVVFCLPPFDLWGAGTRRGACRARRRLPRTVPGDVGAGLTARRGRVRPRLGGGGARGAACWCGFRGPLCRAGERATGLRVPGEGGRTPDGRNPAVLAHFGL